MGENVLAKMHEVMIVLYAFSLIFYFVDYLYNNRKANKIAFWLLCIVWILQTTFFIFYIIETGRFPILTLGEGLYFYSWLLITFSILLYRFLKVEFATFFTNVLGFIIVVIYTYAPFHWRSNVVTERLVSELLFVHITSSILAYVAFSLSAICSLLYLLQYQLLKQKQWGKRLIRINDLSKLENFSFLLNAIGIPLIGIGVILGLQWAYIKIPELVFYDWKIIGSILLVVVYGYYLFSKTKRGISGKKLAYLNIAAFLILLINFFLFGNFSSFHYWYS